MNADGTYQGGKRGPWLARANRLMDELDTCGPRFRPTNFWRPGVAQLMSDLGSRKLREFKSWPSSSVWFYPRYGQGFSNEVIGEVLELARSRGVAASDPWLTSALGGGLDARRDFDAIRLAWNQHRWPFDIEGFGESRFGKPPQRYRLGSRTDVAWGRPYLNYLLCLAALSNHLERPPRRWLELGGGFGVLGEIVHQRDPLSQYVNVDLPPLVVIAEAYLSRLLGRTIVVNEGSYLAANQSTWGAACLPSWHFPGVVGPFDVFVNSFSFQEMEPEVMARYVGLVASVGTEYVVSLNSRLGKPVAEAPGKHGVIEQVTSRSVEEAFLRLGYRTLGRYGAPLIRSAGELLIMRRM